MIFERKQSVLKYIKQQIFVLHIRCEPTYPIHNSWNWFLPNYIEAPKRQCL